jgi:hypothetical protein
VALAALVVVAAGGGSDDDKSSKQDSERFQRMVIGARACMPPATRRRLRRIERQAEAYDERPPDPEALLKDERFARLAKEAAGLLKLYAPGGPHYDAQCFDAAWQRFKRRVARQE